MVRTRLYFTAMALLAFTLTLASCATGPAPTALVEVGATPEAIPSATALVVPTDTPEPTATPAPLQLVVLHTNDNWGETEPCG
jgi:hypothetical protein